MSASRCEPVMRNHWVSSRKSDTPDGHSSAICSVSSALRLQEFCTPTRKASIPAVKTEQPHLGLSFWDAR